MLTSSAPSSCRHVCDTHTWPGGQAGYPEGGLTPRGQGKDERDANEWKVRGRERESCFVFLLAREGMSKCTVIFMGDGGCHGMVDDSRSTNGGLPRRATWTDCGFCCACTGDLHTTTRRASVRSARLDWDWRSKSVSAVAYRPPHLSPAPHRLSLRRFPSPRCLMPSVGPVHERVAWPHSQPYPPLRSLAHNPNPGPK